MSESADSVSPSTSTRRAIASVVVPAHNERAVVQRCIRSLLDGIEPGELEIVVVPNGCTDDTVARALEVHPSVRVSPIDTASKPAAMNHGDTVASVFPRFYVDADVQVTGAVIRSVAQCLNAGEALLASPGLRLDTKGCSPLVKQYVSFWRALPSIDQDCVGRGVYGLSAEGRKRFDLFPSITADDHYVRMLFASSERKCVPGTESVVYPPRDLKNLLRRVKRSIAGLREYQQSFTPPVDQSSLGGWRQVVKNNPRKAFVFPTYAVITAYARYSAVRGGNAPVAWSRDESTR